MKCNYKLYAWLYIIAPIIFALIAPIYYPTFWLMTSLNKLVAGVEKIKCKFIKKRRS